MGVGRLGGITIYQNEYLGAKINKGLRVNWKLMILADFAPVLPEFLSLGLVGVGLVSWLGDDGSDEVDQEGEAGEDFDMGDEDDFGGMDDFDDDFGGMDGMGDGGGGASSTELENRIEDLESEVATVSSTANTVRSENEQISEKVDDVEENVRKLLEIYEMVTRGVNPFVDDVSADAGIGGGGADFGLFGEGEDSADEAAEDLGSDIADAEAEEFFEDDAFDDDFGGEEAFDPDDDSLDEEFGDEAEFGDEDLAGGEFDDFEAEDSMNDEDLLEEEGAAMSDTGGDSSEGSDGGTSFEELKAEYESGEADWAEDEDLDESETGDESAETEPAAEPDDQPDLFHQDDLEAGAESTGESATSEEQTATEAANETTGTTTEPARDTEAAQTGSTVADGSADTDLTTETTTSEDPDAGFQFGAATAADSTEQPHLNEPPGGYLSDVLIMEWLDFLVGEFDARNAIRAINHYERIDWIGEPMRDHCYEVLQGIADGEYPYRDESGPTELTMDDHRQSLRYIENLATGHLDKELGDRLTSLNTNGVQR